MENQTAKATGFKRHLPNITTIIRLLGSFSLLFLINFEKDIYPFMAVPLIWIAAYLFLALTDSIDGMLARKLNAKSNLGAFLDALSDTVLVVIGAATVFVVFAAENLTALQTRIYIGLLIFCAANRVSMNLYAKIFFGVPNMLHSYAWKVFAVACYFVVAFRAFMRYVPLWSVIIVLIINIYSAIDEIVYCAKAASYDVNFKGHGFQQYEKRTR